MTTLWNRRGAMRNGGNVSKLIFADGQDLQDDELSDGQGRWVGKGFARSGCHQVRVSNVTVQT